MKPEACKQTALTGVGMRAGLAAAVFLLFLGAGGTTGAEARESLTVAAASSLQPAFAELGGLYRERAGEAPVFVFASSGVLARQMEHGAPYDLFCSADRAWVEHLVAGGLLAKDSVADFALGRLVLATGKAFPLDPGPDLTAGDLAALLGAHSVRYVALANPAHAPYGVAAREALLHSGTWEPLQWRLVFGENVRQALAFVQSGNAEAALAAEATAATSGLKWRRVREVLHTPIRHALGLHRKPTRPEAARVFLDLLFSARGADVLARHGLRPLPHRGLKTPPRTQTGVNR